MHVSLPFCIDSVLLFPNAITCASILPPGDMVAMTAMGFAGAYGMYYTRFDTSGSSFSNSLPNLGVHVVFRVSWGI